ncbi:MAG: leucine-rich repeat domain-containing protein [Prevotellaceae bacterium]|jgi:Leucine-rich repeat (LRR) protein|nr:leucine-rich repeat domain-containing protein [Prevotellaceae bacterium]
MKKTLKFLSLMLLILTVCACTQSGEQAVMKTYDNEVKFHINKDAANISIAWGDGTTSNVNDGKPTEFWLEFSHQYADSKLHTIVVKADNLQDLTCSYNDLTELDVRRCPMLEELDCSSNQLTSLDVRKCPMLEELDCDGNQLTGLDVSKCLMLEDLDCDDNHLTGLDVSKCHKLRRLNCRKNQLTSLDVSKCPKLGTLRCDDNINVQRQ